MYMYMETKRTCLACTCTWKPNVHVLHVHVHVNMFKLGYMFLTNTTCLVEPFLSIHHSVQQIQNYLLTPL